MFALKSSARNGKIDLLKFLFSIMVIIFHFGKGLYNYDLFTKGYIAVEFFFITSGFLFAKSLAKYPYQKDTFLKDSTLFMKRKFLSFFPYHLFFFIACFLYVVFDQHLGIRTGFSFFCSTIPDLLMLQMGGISGLSLLRYEWYISAMLIVMFLLTPLAIRYRKAFLYYFCPILFLAITGWLFAQSHSLNVVREWTGLCYEALLRATAELALGCICYAIWENKFWEKLPKALLLLIEWGIYTIVFLYSCKLFTGLGDFFALFLLGIAVPISFTDKASLGFLNNRVVYFLGKISFPIYLSQLLVIEIIKEYDFNSPTLHTLVYIGCVISAALICMLVTDNLLRLFRHLRTKLNNRKEDVS